MLLWPSEEILEDFQDSTEDRQSKCRWSFENSGLLTNLKIQNSPLIADEGKYDPCPECPEDSEESSSEEQTEQILHCHQRPQPLNVGEQTLLMSTPGIM